MVDLARHVHVTSLFEDIEAVEPWMDGCNGYYRHASGRVVTQWPKNMTAFREMIAEIDASDFESKSR